MCSTFEKQACKRKDAEDDVDATVVDKDESTLMRRSFQPLQPVVKVVIKPRSYYNTSHSTMLSLGTFSADLQVISLYTKTLQLPRLIVGGCLSGLFANGHRSRIASVSS